MKRALYLFTMLPLLAGCGGGKEEASMRLVEPVVFSNVKIEDPFWSPRLESSYKVTLPVCIDQIENQTGRIRNFENAALGQGEHSGIYYDDSDVYKAMEGIAYTLVNHPDAALEAKMDEWVDKIAAAQQEDGYINTYYILTGLDKRWTDMTKHEMYCAGHLTEAGVAYYRATGKRKLLDVAIKMADHMMSVFGPDKRDWVPGHEEIELALVKLYDVTGKKEYLDFASWLLGERGHGKGQTLYGFDHKYYQDEYPVEELSKVHGHAVRLTYLACGMADVAALTGNRAYIDALDRLWDNAVNCNMYVTGGIGSSSDGEAFTEDFDLPNLEAYCETCASVGMILWNSRMNGFHGDAGYIDVLERSLYNGALAGISLKGDRFFYVNPLESLGDHHREAWYGCACCPSQLSRFIPSIGNYIYGVSDKALMVNLFIGNTAEIPMDGGKIKVSMKTEYPWNGDVTLTVGSSMKKEIRIRIPDWCHSYTLTVDGKQVSPAVEKGYAVLKSGWKAGEEVVLHMDMPVEKVKADPRVKADEDKTAIRRGPVVYCMEEVDNPEGFDEASFGPDPEFEVVHSDILGGVDLIRAKCGEREITLIPYYAWDNRAAGKMKVWIND